MLQIQVESIRRENGSTGCHLSVYAFHVRSVTDILKAQSVKHTPMRYAGTIKHTCALSSRNAPILRYVCDDFDLASHLPHACNLALHVARYPVEVFSLLQDVVRSTIGGYYLRVNQFR